MTFIATKINCDGDKCGACEFFKKEVSFYESPCSQSHDGAVFTKTKCEHFKKTLCDNNRLPECLAGELRVEGCDTCGHYQTPEVHGECPHGPECEWTPNTESSMQPATKGER